MERNCVLGNCWQRRVRCLSIILHLWKSLWKKCTTVYFNLVTQFKNQLQAIQIGDKQYFSVLSDCPRLFFMTLWYFVVDLHPFLLHLLHYFPRLLVLKLIQLVIILQSPPLRLLLLPLLLLLHHNFVPYHLFEHDVVEDVSQQLVLHSNQIILNYWSGQQERGCPQEYLLINDKFSQAQIIIIEQEWPYSALRLSTNERSQLSCIVLGKYDFRNFVYNSFFSSSQTQLSFYCHQSTQSQPRQRHFR